MTRYLRRLPAVFALVVGALTFLPSLASADYLAPCDAPVVDSTHVLTTENLNEIRNTIKEVDETVGADIYVRVWDSFPSDGIPHSLLFTGGPTDVWWRENFPKCSNWSRDDGRRVKDNVVVIGISIGQGIGANKVFIAYGDKFNGISSRISTYIDSEVRLKLVDHDYVAGILAAVKSVDTTVGGISHDDFIFSMILFGAVTLSIMGVGVFAFYGGNESKHTEFGTLDSEEQLTVHRLPRAELRRRVSELKKALLQLDTEWAQYETNLEEFCLTKPMLRDKRSPVIKKYHDMMFDLRNTVESLDDKVDEKSLTTAESLAEDTLSAWGAANDYAVQVGVSDLSVTERAALRAGFMGWWHNWPIPVRLGRCGIPSKRESTTRCAN